MVQRSVHIYYAQLAIHIPLKISQLKWTHFTYKRAKVIHVLICITLISRVFFRAAKHGCSMRYRKEHTEKIISDAFSYSENV